MKIYLQIIRYYCNYRMAKENAAVLNPIKCQNKVFKQLINFGKRTVFGAENNFDIINSYADYTNVLPLQNYETIKPYIEKILDKQQNILWPGLPLYMAESSGTTSTIKKIPVTKMSIYNHQFEPITFLYQFLNKYRNKMDSGKILFLSEATNYLLDNTLDCAAISGIKAKKIPKVIRNRFIPSEKTNELIDYNHKIKGIITESIGENIFLLVGNPLSLLVYLREMKKVTGKNFIDSFPNILHFCSSGMDYAPYLNQLESQLGSNINITESYTASEGFFAYQDQIGGNGMRLLLDQGVFYEFIPIDEIESHNPKRLTLSEIELGKYYSIVVTTTAGLWSYSIGDIISFVNLVPHRIIIVGRTKQYISIFKEYFQVIEADNAINSAAKLSKVQIRNYIVAPLISNSDSLPCYQWFIEFEDSPENLVNFISELNKSTCLYNNEYEFLTNLEMIGLPEVIQIISGGFDLYMKEQRMHGPQKKLTKLSNNRIHAEQIMKYKINY